MAYIKQACKTGSKHSYTSPLHKAIVGSVKNSYFLEIENSLNAHLLHCTSAAYHTLSEIFAIGA